MKIKSLVIIHFMFLLVISIVNGYKIESGTEVHQHITNESRSIWKLQPYEVKNYIKNQITRTTSDNDYNSGDDVVDGSREEDLPFGKLRFKNHFWNPDNPNVQKNGSYDDGLNVFGANVESSYTKAKNLWTEQVIKNYLKGNINESYYWLGRVAHLLEDASQPSHVLIDCHMDIEIGYFICSGSLGDGGADDSILEEYTGTNFNTLRTTYNWTGSNFVGRQYNYENLPNLSNFNWKEVEPTSPIDKQNIELFRLFWYTAQKTQYLASDDIDGNSAYVNLSGNQKNFSISLWQNDAVTIISNHSAFDIEDFYYSQNNDGQTCTILSAATCAGHSLNFPCYLCDNNTGPNINKETNAVIPHSMKAIAGLYILFWDAVHIDWSTENHDYRRTGFTLLKGDLTNNTIVKNQVNLILDDVVSTEQVVKPSVADLDGNGFMDSVVLVHKTSFNTFTKMYGIETSKKQFPYIGTKRVPQQKWPVQNVSGNMLGGAAYFPATLADIDGDTKKEIITGVRNGTVYAYNYSNGILQEKWRYVTEPRIIPSVGDNVTEFNGGTAVDDIDLDGDMEVIFADEYDLQSGWNGKVYVLYGNNGSNMTSYNVGNGGAYASVSVANIDSDDYPEIVVPTQFGIKVLDYNPSTNKLTEKCSNAHGLLESSAIIYDIDKDNDYELIFVTSDRTCDTGKTCLNRLYVIDAQTCANATNFPVSFTEKPRPTPTVANLDSDSQAEIIVSSVSSVVTNLGTITAIDGVSGATQWTYNDGGKLHPGFISPNIADIDNDGNYNIILGENNASTVYILKNDGNLLYKYNVTGFMDNGLAIADIDTDGMAEIVFKRAGSPTLFTSISNENFPPELNIISNITAIAGNLINVNTTGEVSATDSESNNIQFFYSSPFNSSGLWQTTVNDTGNYSILVEASDGNLSTYKFVDVVVFNETTKLVNSFNDSSTQKTLNFTQAENLTVNIRLPKNATVIYSKIKIKGSSA